VSYRPRCFSLKRRSQGLNCVIGNFHAQFLEGWTPAMGSGYSVNCHVRFLEGWAPVMGPGYSVHPPVAR
jgi:hypothetical protein